MKTVLWAIQSICPPQDAQQLMTACTALGIETCIIKSSAVGELPNVATNRPVLFYGSCRFIRKIVASGRWNPGAYYDDRNFRFSELLRHWGARMLNREAVFLTLGEFSAARFAASPKIFVRPDRDLKELSGCVWPVSDFAEYVDKLRTAGNRTALDMPIVVAPTRQIDSEWRLHVIDGKVRLIGCHSPVSIIERRVHHVRSEQILNELAYSSFAYRSIQAFVDSLIKAYGHFSLHDISLVVIRPTTIATC